MSKHFFVCQFCDEYVLKQDNFFYFFQQFDILEPVFSLDPDEYEDAYDTTGDYIVDVEYVDSEQPDLLNALR